MLEELSDGEVHDGRSPLDSSHRLIRTGLGKGLVSFGITDQMEEVGGVDDDTLEIANFLFRIKKNNELF